MAEHKDVLYLCENVVYEFLCGNLNRDERDKFLGFVLQFPVLDFDREAFLKTSEIYRNGKNRGDIGLHPNCMIAGTYTANGVERIVTRDTNHFERIDSLLVVGY